MKIKRSKRIKRIDDCSSRPTGYLLCGEPGKPQDLSFIDLNIELPSGFTEKNLKPTVVSQCLTWRRTTASDKS